METTQDSAQGLSASTWSRVEEAYRQNSVDVLALAYLLTGSRETAEDLVQEAFIRLAGRFRHIRNPDQISGYLRRIVINMHLSGLRRYRLQRAWMRRESSSQPAFSEMPDVGDRDELVRALQSIPPRQRAAVVLRYCLDFSEPQIADTIRCSTSAARNLVGHGIRQLRAQMGGTHEEPT